MQLRKFGKLGNALHLTMFGQMSYIEMPSEMHALPKVGVAGCTPAIWQKDWMNCWEITPGVLVYVLVYN